jgi:hypothetical protein
MAVQCNFRVCCIVFAKFYSVWIWIRAWEQSRIGLFVRYVLQVLFLTKVIFDQVILWTKCACVHIALFPRGFAGMHQVLDVLGSLCLSNGFAWSNWQGDVLSRVKNCVSTWTSCEFSLLQNV